VSATAEEDGRAASWRPTVVALKRMGPTVRRITRDGEKNEKSSGYQHSKLVVATKRTLAKASTDPGLLPCSTPRIWEGMITDHGRISDG
jgi:hypothetical protein